jgi:excisionase family DNA binding protein
VRGSAHHNFHCRTQTERKVNIEEDTTLMIAIRPSELGAIIRREVKAVLGEKPAELMTTMQLAKELDVSQDLIRLWVREQGCPCIRAGQKKFRFRFADVVAWLETKDA